MSKTCPAGFSGFPENVPRALKVSSGVLQASSGFGRMGMGAVLRLKTGNPFVGRNPKGEPTNGQFCGRNQGQISCCWFGL